MPPTMQIALFVLGAVLILIGIGGGNIKIFGAEVAEKVSNPLIKFISIALGGLFIWLAFHTPSSTETKIFVDPRLSSPSPISSVSIKKNDLIEVIPSGDFSWACEPENQPRTWVGPAGRSTPFDNPQDYMLPSAPFCSLIGHVGGGEWHYLGDKNTFIADDSGSLYLTANDVRPERCRQENKQRCYSDNQGTADATVTVKVRKSE